MRKKIVSAAGALLMAAMMACSVSAEGTDDLKTIGTREEGAYQIALTNATGRDISAFKIRTNDVLEFSENLMEEGDVFAADETRFFFYKTEEAPELSDEEAAEAEEQAEESSDEEQTDAAEEEQQIGYDLQITFADDQSTAEINAFPFDHIAEGQICAADGVAFLIYTDIETFEEVNTKEFALSILQQAQDAIRQAEEAAAAAAQPSYSEPSYSAPSYTAPSYTAPSYTAPTYTAPAGGGDDTCIEDGLFW